MNQTKGMNTTKLGLYLWKQNKQNGYAYFSTNWAKQNIEEASTNNLVFLKESPALLMGRHRWNRETGFHLIGGREREKEGIFPV